MRKGVVVFHVTSCSIRGKNTRPTRELIRTQFVRLGINGETAHAGKERLSD